MTSASSRQQDPNRAGAGQEDIQVQQGRQYRRRGDDGDEADSDNLDGHRAHSSVEDSTPFIAPIELAREDRRKRHQHERDAVQRCNEPFVCFRSKFVTVVVCGFRVSWEEQFVDVSFTGFAPTRSGRFRDQCQIERVSIKIEQ